MRYFTSLDPSQWPAAKIKFYKQSDGELFVEEATPLETSTFMALESPWWTSMGTASQMQFAVVQMD